MKTYPVLFESTETNFTTNGIGLLSDAIFAHVIEARNGIFDFTMSYPIDGFYSKELIAGRILRMKPNHRYDYHNFTILNVEKDVSGYLRITGTSSVLVKLNDNLVKTNKLKGTPTAVMNSINTTSVDKMAIVFTSDITTSYEVNWENRNPLNCLVGQQGSVVDVWGGEFLREDNKISLLSKRGHEDGYQIRPGVNLAGFRMTTDIKPLVTRIVPYASYQNPWEDEPSINYGKIVVSPNADKYTRQPVIAVDMTDESIVDLDTLNAKAATYFTSLNKGVDTPKVTINADLVTLQDTSDFNKYKILEDVGLCDMVNVYVPKYDVDVNIKVVEVTYDTINGRNISVVLGDKTLSAMGQMAVDTINAINKSEEAIKEYIITNPSGQRVVYSEVRPDPTLFKEGDIWYEKLADGNWNMYIHNGIDWEYIIGDSIFTELEENIDAAAKEAEEAGNRADEAFAKSNNAIAEIVATNKELGNLSDRLKGSETDIVNIKTEQGSITTTIKELSAASANLILDSDKRELIHRGYVSSNLPIQTSNIYVSEWKATDARRYIGAGTTEPIFAIMNTGKSGDGNKTAKGVPYIYSIYIKNMGEAFQITGNGIIIDIPKGYIGRAVLPKATGSGVAWMQFNFTKYPAGSAVDFIWWHPMISQGTMLAEWSPADEDNARKFSQMEQTINGFQTTVQDTVTESLNGLGNDNLLLETSNVFAPITHWTPYSSDGSKDVIISVDKSNYYRNSNSNILAFGHKQTVSGVALVVSNIFPVQRGSKYTLQTKMYGQANIDYVEIVLELYNKDSIRIADLPIVKAASKFAPSTTSMPVYTWTTDGVIPNDAMLGRLKFRVSRKSIAPTYLFFIETILVEGTSVAGYNPGSRFTQTQITQLSDTIAMTNKEVDEMGQTMESQYLQLSTLIQTTVTDGLNSTSNENLLPNSTFENTKHWYVWAPTANGASVATGTSLTWGNGKKPYIKLQNLEKTTAAVSFWTPGKDLIWVQPNTKYTFQAKFMGSSNVTYGRISLRVFKRDGTQKYYPFVTNFKPKSASEFTTETWTVTLEADAVSADIVFEVAKSVTVGVETYIAEPILVAGSSVAGYTPGTVFTQTQITQLSDTIAMTNKEVDALGKTVESQYLQLSDLIALRVSNIGSDNLILETSNYTNADLKEWYVKESTTTLTRTISTAKRDAYKGEYMGYFNDMSTGTATTAAYSSSFKVIPGYDYAGQVKVIGDGQTRGIELLLEITHKNGSVTEQPMGGEQPGTNTLTTYTGTTKVPSTAISARFMIRPRRKGTSTTGIFFVEALVVQGTDVTGYNPGSVTTYAQIAVMQDSINLKVQKGDIRSQINIEANNILFDVNGNKINITPTTTYIADATIENAHIKNVSATKLTAGTIDAKVINVININASNITSGTINAISITGSTITGGKIESVGMKAIVTIQRGNIEFYTDTWGLLGAIGDLRYGRALTVNIKDGFAVIPSSTINTGQFRLEFKSYKMVAYLPEIASNINLINPGYPSQKGRVIADAENRLGLAGNYGLSFYTINSNDTLTQLGQWTSSGLVVNAGLSVKGSKNGITETTKGWVATPAYELAESYYGDIGIGKTSQDKISIIKIDPLFNETVNTKDYEYHVFVQSYTKGAIFAVISRTHDQFVIESNQPFAEFVWEVKAKRKGFEDERLMIMDI